MLIKKGRFGKLGLVETIPKIKLDAIKEAAER
jgi:hypothetical protein